MVTWLHRFKDSRGRINRPGVFLLHFLTLVSAFVYVKACAAFWYFFFHFDGYTKKKFFFYRGASFTFDSFLNLTLKCQHRDQICSYQWIELKLDKKSFSSLQWINKKFNWKNHSSQDGSLEGNRKLPTNAGEAFKFTIKKSEGGKGN